MTIEIEAAYERIDELIDVLRHTRSIIIAAAIFGASLLSSPANAYHSCDGLLTSNNSCIGSESNVDSRNNHEPFQTGRRDYIRPEIGGYGGGYRNGRRSHRRSGWHHD